MRTSGDEASATIGTETDDGAAALETRVDNSASMVFSRACTSALLLSEIIAVIQLTGAHEWGSSTPFKNGLHRCGTRLATHCEHGSFLSHFCFRRWHSTHEKCTRVLFWSFGCRLTVDAASSSVCGSWLIDGFRSCRLGDDFRFFELDAVVAADVDGPEVLSFLTSAAVGEDVPLDALIRLASAVNEDGAPGRLPAWTGMVEDMNAVFAKRECSCVSVMESVMSDSAAEVITCTGWRGGKRMSIHKGKLSGCKGYKCGVVHKGFITVVAHCCRLHSRAPQLIGDRRTVTVTAGVTWTVQWTASTPSEKGRRCPKGYLTSTGYAVVITDPSSLHR